MKTRNTIKSLLLLLTAGGILSSCSKLDNHEYCNYPARLVYDGSLNMLQPLSDALNSVNSFAFVSAAPFGDGKTSYYLNASLYGSESKQTLITAEKLTKQSHILGLNNRLIIGKSSMQDNQLYVFDAICPNCYESTGVTKNQYMVSFASNGTHVQCPTCKRTYGLLNGGVVVNGESGKKLLRYRASYIGTTLNIANP